MVNNPFQIVTARSPCRQGYRTLRKPVALSRPRRRQCGWFCARECGRSSIAAADMGAHLGAHRRPRIHYCAAAEHIGLQDLAPCSRASPALPRARAPISSLPPFGNHPRRYLLDAAAARHRHPAPADLRAANFDPNDITGSIGRQLLGDANGPLQFRPSPQRQARLADLAGAREPMAAAAPALTIAPMPQAEIEAPRQREQSRKPLRPVNGIRIRRHSRRAEASIFAGLFAGA